MNLSMIRFILCLRELQEPGQRVLDPKVDWVDQQVGEKEEEVCTTKAGQEMVEDVPHRPVKFFFQQIAIADFGIFKLQNW